MKPNTNLKRVAARSGFTLVELLVVITVIGILAALILPALSQAKQKAVMVKCVSNLHQIGIGLRMYVDDNNETFPPANSYQLDPNIRHSLRHGDALGGVDEVDPYYWGSAGISLLPSSKNRLLALYVPAGEVFRCPVDRGRPWADNDPPSVNMFRSFGCSYRFNHRLLGLGGRGVDDPAHNLGLKKESWVPDPTRFISMHEWGAYPIFSVYQGIRVLRWHERSSDPNVLRSPGFGINGPSFKDVLESDIKDARGKFVAPVLFVDGNSQRCDFTASLKKGPSHMLAPTEKWMWYKPLR